MSQPKKEPVNVSEHPTVMPGQSSNDVPTSGPEDASRALSERPTVLPSEIDSGAAASGAVAPAASQLLGGRYRLLKELGRGGMGAVYLAHDELLKLQVALKLLLPGKASAVAAERMRGEAALAIRLTHPNVMRLYDLHLSDTERFIVMEYLPGRPLDAVLGERGSVSVLEAIEIGSQVAAGLDYAHNLGIVHRDIKPANIMLVTSASGDSGTGTSVVAKILDFGIAKAQADIRTGGTRAGTFGYMPPEQFLGKRYDRRADVFALGVMLYEMLTGELPFERSGAISPQARPKRIDRFSSEVNLVLTKAVAWNAGERWATAGSFMEALTRAIGKDVDLEPSGAARPTAGTMVHTAGPAAATADEMPTVKTDASPLESQIVHPADGAPMTLVPAGPFRMGTNNGDPDEEPEHEVWLSDFYVDIYPVTNARFAQFLNEVKTHQDDAGHLYLAIGSDTAITVVGGRYVVREGFEDHPAVHVSWFGAEAYCLWAGKRLPTEAEWEKAARGDDARAYPWGNEEPQSSATPRCNAAGFATTTTAVDHFPGGASPHGCLDMAGNVLEWCADWFQSGFYAKSPKRDPTGPTSGTDRVCRGGCFHFDAWSARATYRVNMDPAHLIQPTGFRCAMSA